MSKGGGRNELHETTAKLSPQQRLEWEGETASEKGISAVHEGVRSCGGGEGGEGSG